MTIFSKNADICFTWPIKTLEGLHEPLAFKKQKFNSLKFTISSKPDIKWLLSLLVTKLNQDVAVIRQHNSYAQSYLIHHEKDAYKKVINIVVVCSKILIIDPVKVKVDISILNDLNNKVYTRSLIHSGEKHELHFNNFIEWEEMVKIIQNGQLNIYVEMFLPETQNFDCLSKLDFLSDIQIVINGQKFNAHKAILAAKSPYFCNVFKQDKEIKEINNLNSIKSDAFEEILRYIYSDNVKDSYFSCDILLAASILQIKDLKTKCEDFLENNITLDVVLDFLILAFKCDAKFLLDHCLYYTVKEINILQHLKCLETEPLVTLIILKEIFDNCVNKKVQIVDKICLSCDKSATNTSNFLLQEYEQFLNNENLSDINIQIGEKIFQSHKVVLAAKSPVLYRMLMSNMKETLNNCIKIKDMEAEVCEEILRYMYTGKVNIVDEYAIDILKAAEQYDLQHLKKICEEFLTDKLTHDNVIDIVKISDDFQASILKPYCIRYIIKQKVLSSQQNKATNIILDSLSDKYSNILYEILDVLRERCDIEYI